MHDPFDFTPKAKQFTVIGKPIEHSLSPEIHQQFSRQANIELEYTKTLGESGGFQQAVQHFMASGGAGMNVTVPFKLEAFALCDELTPRAELAAAVNTIWFDEDKIHGDMTDGAGLITDIGHNQKIKIAGQRVLLIGAGGAVRGVLQPLLDAQPSEVIICNRTEGKAIELAALFSNAGNIHSRAMNDLSGQAFDIIINGTAASLEASLPSVSSDIFAKNCFAYDMMYARQPTIFMKWALANGAAKATDGLGMLVEQAALGFTRWHGVSVQTAPVIDSLRQGA